MDDRFYTHRLCFSTAKWYLQGQAGSYGIEERFKVSLSSISLSVRANCSLLMRDLVYDSILSQISLYPCLYPASLSALTCYAFVLPRFEKGLDGVG